ncbi:MAG: hypothetical protein AAGF95_07085 [Chloroflexota bacterium]
MDNPNVRLLALSTTFILSSFLSLCFVYAFYERFLRWFGCFNDQGRCYDPVTQTVYTTGGWCWSVPAIAFGSVVLVSGYLLLQTLSRKDSFSTYHHSNGFDD